MVFVQRDEKGRVLRVEHEPFDNMTQSMPANGSGSAELVRQPQPA